MNWPKARPISCGWRRRFFRWVKITTPKMIGQMRSDHLTKRLASGEKRRQPGESKRQLIKWRSWVIRPKRAKIILCKTELRCSVSALAKKFQRVLLMVIGMGCLVIWGILPAAASTVQQSAQASAKAVNCAVTPTQILGQASSGLAGVAGETTSQHIIPPPDANAGQSAVSLAIDPNWIAAPAQAIKLGTEPVAVLVIDDFHQHTDAIKTHGELVYEVFQKLFKAAGLNA